MSSSSPPEPTHLSGDVFVAATGSLLLHALAASSLFGFIGFVMPLLDQLYQEHEVKLTQTAEQILSFSRLYLDYWPLVILGVAIVDLVIVVLLARLPASRRWILTGFNYLWLAVTLIIVTRAGALVIAPIKGWLGDS